MCRNIRTLYNFEPPATEDEVRAASLKYVRKISGFTKPSRANAEAFEHAVDAVAAVSRELLDRLGAHAARDERAAEGPRGRGREGQGPLGGALRHGVVARNARRSGRAPAADRPQLC